MAPLHVDDLARAARTRSEAELLGWLGNPRALLIGPERGGKVFAGVHTEDHTPRPRDVSPADFLEHVVLPVPAERTTIVLGRDAGCDVRIRHDSVSARHAELTIDTGARVTLRDLGSRNGTFARGALIPAQRTVTVRHGDSIQLGARVFKLYDPSRLYVTLKRIVPTAE